MPLDYGGYFDLTTVDVATDLRRRTILALESIGIPVRYSHHEDAPSQHEIDLRYTDALTMADNVMTFQLVVKEIALERGRLRLVHAQAAGRRAGLGHAHPPLAVRGRRQRLPRPGRRGPPVQGGQGLHRRPAPPRPGDHRRHQPVGQLLQAAGRRLRGAGLRGLGPQQPLRPGARPGVEEGQAGVDPHRVPLARPRLQPLPRLRRHPGRRPARASRRATSCRPSSPPTSTR